MGNISGVANQIVISALVWICLVLLPANAGAQTLIENVKPDFQRALKTRPDVYGTGRRPNGYVPARREGVKTIRNSAVQLDANGRTTARLSASAGDINSLAAGPIAPGTPLTQILHTSQISLISTAGSNEQYFDENNDLVADKRTTFDSLGGSFDIAVGRSGARYEVYSATLSGQLIGVLVVARDSNGDYFADASSTFNLRTDFNLRSAASVVTGNSKTGREFVIVCSSGYFNESDPDDPNNEPSPGVIVLVRDPNTGGFDVSRTRTLVTVGDNRLYNANALALLPNNDLLIADYHSNELRIVRDTDADGMPDTLSTTPFYSYQFSNDAPLDVATNSRGVVFSHSVGNDTVMLAIYDDNSDGEADRDEVCVEGLSIDNNLLLHGLSVDEKGSVYVIEDASGSADGSGGNGGTPRVDGFPDRFSNGFLSNGAVFANADDALNHGLTGLSFGALPANKIDDPQFFVRQHYFDFLSRYPDASGLAYWTNQIISCGTDAQCIEIKRINVSAAFFLSIEFQETGYLVYKFYKAAFGNLPGAPVPVRFNEFLTDTRDIAQDVEVGIGNWEAKLESNKQAFALAFVGKPAFTSGYSNSLTPAQFVDILLAHAGVTPTNTERNAAIAEFGSATTSADTAARARALRRVAENPVLGPGSAEFNSAFVLMQYFGYLRRNPNDPPDSDFNGYFFWLNKLNEFHGNFVQAQMVKAFLDSIEYRSAFGS